MTKLLAFDYGASSGRGILGNFNGDKLDLTEIHRFSSDPVMINGSFHWDILRLFHEMKQGIHKCNKNGEKDIAGIGVDTWGVDFGLLGSSGELLGNPYHYRDARTEGMIEEACKIVPKREIYEQTGIAFQKFNTLYQLLAMKLNNSPILEKASTMLFIPDLLNYFLTGEKLSEYTITSTSQMYDPTLGTWAKNLLTKLGLPINILTDVINAGTVIGSLNKSISNELNISNIPVIAVAGHDTGSAVVSVPVTEGRYAYISSGTWSLMGMELSAPIINDKTFSLNYTNEGGINKTTRLLKNIMGLWIYQECKRAWDKTDEVLEFDELEDQATKSKAFVSLIDPDNDLFYSPGNMPDKIREFCRNTNQIIPESKGAVVRCVMESLALKYKQALSGLEEIVGFKIPVLHIVGGGSKNIMLNQFTANATGIPVITGPTEATAVGNLVCQLLALKEIANVNEGRMLVKRSFPTRDYLPTDRDEWEAAYGRFVKLVGK
jgi:rhamnulokinase